MTGKYVSFAAAFATGVVLALFLPLWKVLLVSLPAGIFYGYLGAWYDRG